MPRAAGLAARIEERTGLSPTLIEGHNGIFKIDIDGACIYTNRSECSVFPTDDDIFGIIEEKRSGKGT